MVSRKGTQQHSKKSTFKTILKIAQENGITKVVLPTQPPLKGSFREKDVEGRDFVLQGESLSQLPYFKVDNSIGLGDQDNQYRNSGC